MPRMPSVYCLDIQDTVSTEDVTEFILEHDHMPALQCPNEACRAKNPDTRFTCVCCDPDDPCERRVPHFRIYPKHVHSKECRFGEMAENQHYVLQHKTKFEHLDTNVNLLRELESIDDTSLLPDAYVFEYDPSEGMREIEEETKKLVAGGMTRREAGRIAVCMVPHKTGSLNMIVRMGEKLDQCKEDWKNASLQLPGRQIATYFSAFFNIVKLQENFTTPYILYDPAHVSRYEEGFLIRYTRPLAKYSDDYPELHAVTPLSDEMLGRSRIRRSLTEQLERYAASGEECCVYSFSRHCLKANNCPDLDRNFCVVIEPRTPDALVIRNRCVYRGKNRQF